MTEAGEVTTINNWLLAAIIGRNPKRTLVRIIVLVVTVFSVANYVLLPIRVQGISMLPTYPENCINCINCLAYLFHPPQRGDIVGIKLAGKHLMYLKRVIGLPGETIEFRLGKVLINGTVLDEPYLKLPCQWDSEPEQVGPNEYYVVGDNRSMPIRYHEQGRADRARIAGKAVR